jgi:O-antigen/teichoic acid export membrane protein
MHRLPFSRRHRAHMQPHGALDRAPARVLAGNTLFNALSYGSTALIGLVTLPFLIHHFGAAEFGLYSVALGASAFLTFLNFGLNISLSKFVAEFSKPGMESTLRGCIGNSYLIALIANVVIAVILILLGFVGSGLLHIASDQTSMFRRLSLAVAVGAVATGYLQVPRGILAGLQRSGTRTRCDVFTTIGPLIGVASTVLFETSLITYTIIVYAGQVLSGILMVIATRRLLPVISHRPAFNRSVLRLVLPFSRRQAGAQIADILFYASDRLILQRLFGPVVVAQYAVADRLRSFSDIIVSLPLTTVVPMASRAHSDGDHRRLERLIFTGTPVYLMILLPPLIVLMAVMRPFLGIWIGPDYMNVAPYAQIIMVGIVATAPFKVFSHVMVGKGRVKEITRAKMGFAPANAALSFILARHLGMLGVFIPTAVFWVSIYPCIWLRVMRAEGISRRRFAARCAPVLAVGAAGGLIVAVAVTAGLANSFIKLALLAGLTTSLMYTVLICLPSLRDERRAVVDVIRSLGDRGGGPLLTVAKPPSGVPA